VDRTTVYRWSNLGILHPARTAMGHRRYSAEEVEQLARRLEAGEVIETPTRGSGTLPEA
jgi:predicted site-specific integrase-resolvase